MKKSKEKGTLAYLAALLAPYEIGGMDVDAEAIVDVKMETNPPLPRASPTLLLFKLNEDGANSELLLNDARRFSLNLRIQQQHTSFNSNSDVKDSQEAIENLLLPAEKTTSRPQSPSNLQQLYLVQSEAISPLRFSRFGLNARRSTCLGSHLESKVEGDLQSSDIFEDLTKKTRASKTKKRK